MTPVTASKHDYPPEAYALLAESEKKHFWFRGRNLVIRNVIQSTFPGYTGKRILEVGCGTGYVLSELVRMGFAATGLDMHPEGLVFAKQRVPGASFITGSLEYYHVKTPYDAVGMFDVLEHISKDADALHQCAELLKKNGMLFLTVPARPELHSVYDDISGHKRRYTKARLEHLLVTSGFRIHYIGYFGFLQYIPHLFMKRLMLGQKSKNDTMSILRRVAWQPPLIINWLLEKSFALDLLISKFVPLPLGTSLIVSAQKAV